MFSRGRSGKATGRQPKAPKGDGVQPPMQPPKPEPSLAAQTATAPTEYAGRDRISTIGPDLRIAGNLYCKGELHIEGQIEGDINSSSVSVRKGALITGSIEAENILIDGAVNGQIKAPTVTIASSARVTGDVIHQTLAVEEGAHLEGHCRRMRSGEQARGAAPLKSAQSSQHDVD